MRPFGWAADAVAVMAVAEPMLLVHLIELDRRRMHLIALALAHVGETSVALARLLATGSMRDVLGQVLGHSPAGIGRALERMPFAVLRAENYRRVVELLGEPAAAKVLHHEDMIDNATVAGLHGCPAALRTPAVIAALGGYDGVARLREGLGVLAARGAAPDGAALVARLAAARQPGQVVAALRRAVDAMPLPATLPPRRVGRARRLDRGADIRALARRWNNCLADYRPMIDEGTHALYLRDAEDARAACLVRRHGRLGWFLEELNGPGNEDLEPDAVAIVRAEFAAAGIPEVAIVETIEEVVEAGDTDTRLTAGARRRRASMAEENDACLLTAA